MAVCVVFMVMAAGPTNGYASIMVYGIVWFYALMRFGFIAAFLTQVTFNIGRFPTLDASAWYSGYSYLVLAIFAAIVLFAFRYSLGGRPLISAPHLDD